MNPHRIIIVPGWRNSGPDHWQSLWAQQLPHAERVEQDDWLVPHRDPWVAALEQLVLSRPEPVVLAAHSLGCITVAHWAAQARPALLRRVRGALLVAPADVERPTCAPALRNFAPIPTDALPFPSQVVSSDNDPAVNVPRALYLAQAWGAEAGLLSNAGHINVKSGHERWEQGFAYLDRLQSRVEQRALRRA